MDLLASGYGSDSGEDDDKVGHAAKNGTGKRPARELLDDTDTEDSSDESVDSAQQRAAEAAARLRDYGEGDGATASSRRPAPSKAATSLLPSALDVLGQVDAPPDFLNPEAIRPLAAAATHGLSAEQLALLQGGPAGPTGRKTKQKPGKDFDISVLAPPLKGQAKAHPDGRDVPAGAVIAGKAQRYAVDDGPEATQTYTAAQIAMMGGKVAAAGEGPEGARVDRGAPTKPMAVTDFLDKGLGAAQLPRKAQDRKDKEKNKRMKGQSTHASWKSEAEMVLRQQFDS